MALPLLLYLTLLKKSREPQMPHLFTPYTNVGLSLTQAHYLQLSGAGHKQSESCSPFFGSLELFVPRCGSCALLSPRVSQMPTFLQGSEKKRGGKLHIVNF